MSHEEAFLRDILANPDDDTPRLVFADWLEERENPHGDFIRTELQLDRVLNGSPSRHALEYRARQLLCISDGRFRFEGKVSQELEARDNDLLSRCGARWVGPVAGLANYWGFRRGFVQEVGLSGRQFLKNAEDLFRFAPVMHVSFTKVPPVLVPTLTTSPYLTQLRSVCLAHNRIGARGALGLAECPHLAGVATLDLTHCHIGDDGLRALLSSPCLPQLKALHLWNNDLSEAGAHLLVKAPTVTSLAYLSIGCNPLGETGKAALRERFGENVNLGL
jgi:uncharacterized protein (TIGR02996 family)